MNESRANRKIKLGRVTSNKMDKSVVVTVDRLLKHPKYRKYIRKRSHFMAHDEKQQCKVGDTVRIIESRPISKHKKWRVLEVVEASREAAV